MSEKRLLAVLALLLGLVAGLILILGGFDFPKQISLEWFGRQAVTLILGLVLIVAALVTYGGKYIEGGILSIALGVVAVFWFSQLPGVLAIIGGLLGVVAEES